MELSDYDILGISKDATFKIVKSAYYDLSKIYHPDSVYSYNNRIKLTKEERLLGFEKIQQAYENIKKKLNIAEVDLPKIEIEYENDITIVNNNELSELSNDNNDEFNKKFNKLFNKVSSQENNDNPFSIYYVEPNKDIRNLCDTKLAIKSLCTDKSLSTHEFGINYVEDHSSDIYLDIRKINNEIKIDKNTKSIESLKETIDNELDQKFENLLKIREENFEMTESEFHFIKKQKQLRLDIEKSKKKVIEKRNKNFLY